MDHSKPDAQGRTSLPVVCAVGSFAVDYPCGKPSVDSRSCSIVICTDGVWGTLLATELEYFATGDSRRRQRVASFLFSLQGRAYQLCVRGWLEGLQQSQFKPIGSLHHISRLGPRHTRSRPYSKIEIGGFLHACIIAPASPPPRRVHKHPTFSAFFCSNILKILSPLNKLLN